MKNIGLKDIVLGHLNLGDTYYYPLKSTVHISHIAQHAVAGERHAFSFEEDRSQETEDRMRGAATAVISTDRREREVEKSFRAEPHAERAETRETPVISSETKWSREILLCRSIAKREKISHRLHGFSQKIQSDDELCSQASGLHGAGRRENENKRHTNLRDGSL